MSFLTLLEILVNILRYFSDAEYRRKENKSCLGCVGTILFYPIAIYILYKIYSFIFSISIIKSISDYISENFNQGVILPVFGMFFYAFILFGVLFLIVGTICFSCEKLSEIIDKHKK